MIWTDRAGPAAGCALVRSFTHELRNRIAAGFATTPGARFAGKGGSFPGVVANDAGVLSLANGHRYAIAILTRTRHAYAEETLIDQHIATIAATAIGQLRQSH
jgi:beta-lactamase class A